MQHGWRQQQYNSILGSGVPGVGGALALEQRLLALPGVVAYWPCTDLSGTAADNAEGTAALDGTYGGTRTLAGAAFPVGGNVVTMNAGWITLPEANLRDAINWSKGWWIGWAQSTTAALTDGARHQWIQIHRNGDEDISIYKDIANYAIHITMETGNTVKTADWYCARDQWSFIALTWDVAGVGLKIYIDGVLMQTLGSMGTPILGAVASQSALIGSGQGTYKGGMGHFAIGAGYTLTETQINTLYMAVRPGSREITYAGDSKANNNDHWPILVLDSLDTATGHIWRERPGRQAVAGYTAAQLHTLLDAQLPGALGHPSAVLMMIGANDESAGTNEATYKAALTGCIDAYLTQFPSTTVYVAKPYREDVATPTSPATLAGWIDAVIATYGSNVLAGHDENGWFKTGIATYSDDLCHYNAAGAVAAAAQWMTILGY